MAAIHPFKRFPQLAAARAVRLTQVFRKMLRQVVRAAGAALTQVLTLALPQREHRGKVIPVHQLQPQATCTVAAVGVRAQRVPAQMVAQVYLVR
jgi:hypothetical protein